MSIDARIECVIQRQDGSGWLSLIDRPPARPGDTGGCCGQSRLDFAPVPYGVAAMMGRDIWGGSETIMLGGVEIARRTGYGSIEFHDEQTFLRALAATKSPG